MSQNPIDAKIAGLLSAAAYSNKDGTFSTLPDGWEEVGRFGYDKSSKIPGGGAFRILKNDSTKPPQLVFDFKGSDKGSDFTSDLANNGSAVINGVVEAAETEYANLLKLDWILLTNCIHEVRTTNWRKCSCAQLLKEMQNLLFMH